METYSLPMRPSVFYGFSQFRIKHEVLERPLIISLEIIAKECSQSVKLSKKAAEVPSFLLKYSRLGGFHDIAVKTVERIIRNELFSAPAGEEISDCRECVLDVSAMFSAVPLIEGDLVARIPVVFAREVRFRGSFGDRKTSRAILLMKPQNFGFLITEKGEFEKMLKSIEKKISSAFKIV